MLHSRLYFLEQAPGISRSKIEGLRPDCLRPDCLRPWARRRPVVPAPIMRTSRGEAMIS